MNIEVMAVLKQNHTNSCIPPLLTHIWEVEFLSHTNLNTFPHHL